MWDWEKLLCILHDFVVLTARCDPLPDPANGAVKLTGFNLGATATYKCDAAYELAGDSTRTCIEGLIWNNMEPLCACKLKSGLLAT